MPRASEPSVLFSLDDEPHRPSQRLYSLAADLAALAPRITHRKLGARPSPGPRWFETFPGEHYHLLTALSMLLRPAIVWEFGTDTGMSAIALHAMEPRSPYRGRQSICRQLAPSP